VFSRRIILAAIVVALVPASPLCAQSKVLRIAAAADLQPVLPALVQEFEKDTHAKVEVSYASSATLATQILNGAPYDLFLAANRAFPQKIVDAHLALESQPVTYARGELVLWARHGILRGRLSMQSLTDPSVRRVAVANPVHAPYGAAAMAAIHSLGLTAALQPKLVFAENIAQAAQYGQSGNADCAMISKTIAITPSLQRAGRFISVPQSSYPPIEQGAVVIRKAAESQLAVSFLRFMQSSDARRMLNERGLQAP
jgi:molybdate transport system substrate-binding protein